MVRSIILLLTLLVAVANSVPVLNVEPEPRITKNDTFELNSEEFVEVNEPELRKPTEKPSAVNEDPIKVEHKELHRVELTNGKSSDDKKDSDNKLCNEFCAKKLENQNQSSCVNGCHYYVYHQILNSGQNMDKEKMKSKNIEACSVSCADSYEKESVDFINCYTGCNVESDEMEFDLKPNVAIGSSNSLNDHIENDNDDFVENDDFEQHRRPFSLFIPMMNQNQDNSFNNQPSSLMNLIMSLVRSTSEQAKQMFEHDRARQMFGQPMPDSASDDNNAITVQRSMFVMMTRDQDGNKKIIYSLPKVYFHRVVSKPLFEQPQIEHSNNDLSMDPKARLKELEKEMESRIFMNKDRFALNNVNDDRDYVETSKTIYTRTWSSCVYMLLPRIFYIILILLVIYIVAWFFYTIPSYFYRPRQVIIPVTQDKPRKFFFDGNQKYFKLKSKLNSLSQALSPPPYSECQSPAKKPLTDDVPYDTMGTKNEN